MDTLTNKIIKTRKPQHCWGCAREFPSGSSLRLIETVDAGTFSRSYWCRVCESIWNEEGYFEEIGYGEMRKCDEEFWEEMRFEMEGGER